jgi:DNA-binding transcriptional MerR regulator
VHCEGSVDCPTLPAHPSLRQIGEVATLVGLSLRTVRHYEDAGLVSPAARTQGGFRLYDEDAVDRLRLIMQMKPLGFTLEEMRILIDVRSRLSDGSLPDDEAADLRERLAMYSVAASEKVAQLREQLEIAEGFARTLEREAARFAG